MALVALGESRPHRVGGACRLAAIANVDLDLAAAQAGGDLDLGQGDPARLHLTQAFGDLGLGHAEHAQRVSVQRRGPLQQSLNRLRLQRRGPHRLQLAGRTGKDDDQAAVRRHDQPGRGADWIERDRALRNHRLLAVGLAHRLWVEVEAAGETAQDRRDLLLDLLVEDQVAAGEAGDDLGGEVVGGRAEPARGDDQVHPLG